jgi:hypothetical protein
LYVGIGAVLHVLATQLARTFDPASQSNLPR